MITKFNNNPNQPIWLAARPVFQGVDNAPPSPEQFQGPEKQSMEDRLNEVAAQTPSEIYSDTISAGTAVKTRYAQNTTILANLATDDPLATNASGTAGTGTGGATGTGSGTATQTAIVNKTGAATTAS